MTGSYLKGHLKNKLNLARTWTTGKRTDTSESDHIMFWPSYIHACMHIHSLNYDP